MTAIEINPMEFVQQPFYGKVTMCQVLSWVASVPGLKVGRKMDEEANHNIL